MVLTNLVMYAVLLALTVGFARAGERWMERRFEARNKPRFEAEA